MIKNIQENPIKQAKTKRICTRAEQIEHSPERAKLFARNTKKKRTTLTEIYELDKTYSNGNKSAYSIKLIDTTRKTSAEPLEDIYINNIPDRYAFQEIETGNPRKVVRKFATFTIVSEKIGGYTPPRAAPPKKKYKSYIHVMKPFAEFTPLDWYLWHKADKKARGVYWAESNRRDKQRAKGKPWDKYYVKSSQSLVQAPGQSQSKKNITNNQNIKLLIQQALNIFG